MLNTEAPAAQFESPGIPSAQPFCPRSRERNRAGPAGSGHRYSCRLGPGETVFKVAGYGIVLWFIVIVHVYLGELRSLQWPAIGVLAVPSRGVIDIRRGGECRLIKASGNVHLDAHSLQARRDRRPAHGNVECEVVFAARRAFALVMQPEGRARDRQRFAERLVLAADDGFALFILLVDRRVLVDPRWWWDRIGRRPVWPVVVPGREVRDGHAPQCLAGCVECREARTLHGGDTEGSQCRRAISRGVAVRVEIGNAARDAEHLDHTAVDGGDPLAFLPVVVTRGHGGAHREPEEVLDVNGQGTVELDGGGPPGNRFVGAQLGAVGIPAAGR